MSITWPQGLRRPLVVGLVASAGISLVSCSQVPQKPFSIDGSSTVYPISKAILEQYQKSVPSAPPIQINFSGTTGGFRQFCQGKTQISNASRPINQEEMTLCNQNQVRFIELPIAFDALTLVVNPQNSAVNNLTVGELKTMWEPQAEGKVMKWNQVNPSFPDQPLRLVGPGTDSGTFDYFVETILGKEGEIREDFTPSEDDNVLVEGVANDENALGYFGYAYFIENEDSLNAVAVDGGEGCVEPSEETIQDGTYAPLSRPLYIYINKASLARPEVQAFVGYYLDNAAELATDVGFVASPDEVYAEDVAELEAMLSGAEATPAP